MPAVDYIRQFFTDECEAWQRRAYSDDPAARHYALGNERVARALEAIIQRRGGAHGELLDLGCGGGQLCFEAVTAGMRSIGIDVAEGMIRSCEASARRLPDATLPRVRFRCADVLSSGFDDASFDAVAALGLLEYLPADAPFLREAWRLLRPGGVLVLSCRNRLFNLASLNEYTAQEIGGSSAAGLLSDVGAALAKPLRPEAMHAFLRSLKAALPLLEEAVQRDLALRGSARSNAPRFVEPLRQHTPRELVHAAEQVGFIEPSVISIHAHPFPPACEASTPHFYNALAWIMQTLAEEPASLAWSSCFQVTLTKPLF